MKQATTKARLCALLLWLVGIIASSPEACTADWSLLCPQLITDHDTASRQFPISLAGLPATARVRICEKATASQGGVLLIENLYEASELEMARQEYRSYMKQPRGKYQQTELAPLMRRLTNLVRCAPTGVDAICSIGIGSSYWNSQFRSVSEESQRKVTNLHHDRARDQNPPIFVSALVYLNDEFAGGETFFPTMPPPVPANNTSAIKASLREEIHEQTDNLLNVHSTSGCQLILGDSQTTVMRQMCDDLKQHPYNHFAIKPKRGGALVFWHWVRTNETIEWARAKYAPEHGEHWHGACPAAGDGRATERQLGIFFGSFQRIEQIAT